MFYNIKFISFFKIQLEFYTKNRWIHIAFFLFSTYWCNRCLLLFQAWSLRSRFSILLWIIVFSASSSNSASSWKFSESRKNNTYFIILYRKIKSHYVNNICDFYIFSKNVFFFLWFFLPSTTLFSDLCWATSTHEILSLGVISSQGIGVDVLWTVVSDLDPSGTGLNLSTIIDMELIGSVNSDAVGWTMSPLAPPKHMYSYIFFIFLFKNKFY